MFLKDNDDFHDVLKVEMDEALRVVNKAYELIDERNYESLFFHLYLMSEAISKIYDRVRSSVLVDTSRFYVGDERMEEIIKQSKGYEYGGLDPLAEGKTPTGQYL